MIQSLIGPIAELAGGWLKGKADANAAAANLKLVEAEAKATIMKNAATSESDWERVMAEGSQNSWKDEWLTVQNGFAALESMPDWYQYTLGVIVAASFGVRSATKFFGGKK
jgi:hypothetical protein